MDLLLLYSFQKMFKNFSRIFLIITFLFIFSRETFAASPMLTPSLADAMKQNEQLVRENFVENKNTTTTTTTTTVTPVVKPQFTPALADNYIYETVYSGAAISVKKAIGSEFYIQDVDFSKGASVSSALEVASYDPKTGEPEFVKQNMKNALNSFLRTPTTMINGQFFSMTTQPSQLSFNLKSDGIIRTAGADDRGESKNILRIADDYAEIVPYSWKNLEATTGSFAMGNFTTKTPKYKNESIGRTYICTPNVDKNNHSSRILVFTAQAITEGLLENEIYKHGCTPKTTSKLDSSGSTRLYYNGKTMYGNSHNGTPDYRLIPHYIAFFDSLRK